MATVYALAFAVCGLVIMHASLVIWTALVLPGPVARARGRLETKPVTSFFAGLSFLALTVLAYGGFRMLLDDLTIFVANVVQNANAVMHLPRFHNDEYIIANCIAWPVLGAPTMVGWIIGGAALAPVFAGRARTLMQDDRPLLALVLGALTQSFAYFLPAVGWFLFFPVTGLMSIGAGLLAILRPGALAGGHAGSVGGKASNPREAEKYESELASP
jgi:hypothetical protein